MNDDLDDLFAAAPLSPPPDFARSVVARARATPQSRPSPRDLKPWQWLSLGAGAGVGAWLLSEFAAVAFIASAAH